jgi:hypothetical protein
MSITVDLFLYGELARYAVQPGSFGYANVKASLAERATIRDLLAGLGLPTEERGITFVNGQLSAMPGIQPTWTTLWRAMTGWHSSI